MRGAIFYLYAGGEALFAFRGAQARWKISRVPSASVRGPAFEWVDGHFGDFASNRRDLFTRKVATEFR